VSHDTIIYTNYTVLVICFIIFFGVEIFRRIGVSLTCTYTFKYVHEYVHVLDTHTHTRTHTHTHTHTHVHTHTHTRWLGLDYNQLVTLSLEHIFRGFLQLLRFLF
jgi:hypothetical protein